jgi:heptosyltransferase-1
LWPEADWIGLGAALRAQGLRCVFAWGVAAERERAQRLARGVNAAPAQGYADAPGATQATEASQAPQGPQALAAPQAFGLDAWMRVLRAAEVVVGVDTGLLYLGAAVGTPAVGIYTGSSPHSVDFESAGPWRGVGERGRPPALDEVLAAVVAVRAPAAD